MTIGNGGSGADTSDEATNGTNTSFTSGSNSVTAFGGGAGASPYTNYNGSNGGSGGGAGTQSGQLGTAGLETSGSANFGTFSAFGEQGGTGGYCGTGQRYTGGGGGGAGSPGSQFNCDTVGGDGLQWVDGNTYAEGGDFGVLEAPSDNTGGGGPCISVGSIVPNPNSNDGASGIVKLRYKGLQKATGGTITESGGYIYHTFTSADTFSVYSTVDA